MQTDLKIVNQKNCPKCRGKLFLDRDAYGWYFTCCLCGYNQDIPDPNAKPPVDIRKLKD